MDINFNWSVGILKEKGLQSDWIFAQCGTLVNDMEYAHEKYGVSQHLVAEMPRIAQEIEQQLLAQDAHYSELDAQVEENVALMLRQEILVPPEDIEHLVLERLQLQMEQGDLKAAMALMAYQGHKRLSAVEERQQKQADEFLLLQKEQQRLAHVLEELKNIEVHNAEMGVQVQQQLDQQKAQQPHQRRRDVTAAVTQWLQAQPQNTRQKTFWKW
jgi:hypothetical protein